MAGFIDFPGRAANVASVTSPRDTERLRTCSTRWMPCWRFHDRRYTGTERRVGMPMIRLVDLPRGNFLNYAIHLNVAHCALGDQEWTAVYLPSRLTFRTSRSGTLGRERATFDAKNNGTVRWPIGIEMRPGNECPLSPTPRQLKLNCRKRTNRTLIGCQSKIN